MALDRVEQVLSSWLTLFRHGRQAPVRTVQRPLPSCETSRLPIGPDSSPEEMRQAMLQAVFDFHPQSTADHSRSSCGQ